jgi:hypothetical protein
MFWGFWDAHGSQKGHIKLSTNKSTVILEVLFGIAVSCMKLSLLIMTRRIMTKGTGILRHVAAVTMFIVGCEGFIFAIVVVLTCSPVSAYWTLSATPQKCINEKAHLLAGGVINTFTDFLVFFLPLPTVLALQMPRRQHVILSILFDAGGIVCIAGIVRIIYAYKTTSTFDRTYGLWIASCLELYIGIASSYKSCPHLLGFRELDGSRFAYHCQ